MKKKKNYHTSDEIKNNSKRDYQSKGWMADGFLGFFFDF